MKNIILDVDTGIDDALAIAYGIRSNDLNILGITTSFGNVSVEDATRNTLNVLEFLDVELPVSAGAKQPIFRKHLKPKSDVHGKVGLGNLTLPDPQGKKTSKTASEFMIEQVKKDPNNVTLICVGPLTNLALAIMQAPEIVHLVKNVIIMGGAITVPGNYKMLAEANIYSDPEAAKYIFQSGISTTLVGLDVTTKAVLPKYIIDEWRGKGSKLHMFLAEITDYYMDFYDRLYPDLNGCALHDPLAVATAIDASFVETKELHVDVDTEGIYSLGRTIGDLREGSKQEPNVNVCLDVDQDRFVKHFLDTIG